MNRDSREEKRNKGKTDMSARRDGGAEERDSKQAGDRRRRRRKIRRERPAGPAAQGDELKAACECDSMAAVGGLAYYSFVWVTG